MKYIDRAVIRGKKLDPDCYRAQRVKHNRGKEDNRILCYGLLDMAYEYKYCDCCLECKAFVWNDD